MRLEKLWRECKEGNDSELGHIFLKRYLHSGAVISLHTVGWY